MSLIPIIKSNKMEFINPANGAVKNTVSLPGNATYTGPIVSGNSVTVSVHYKNGKNKSYSYDLNTGKIINILDM
jgi:hypothetical protein|tara:strand:- start:536 stop:757 length:222 start_codon:yes stop_codon:yes gene_type:complete